MKSCLNVETKDGKLYVESPYSATWVERARTLGGRWKAPWWVFDLENENLVRAVLKSIYGEDGNPTEYVTIDVHLDANTSYEDTIEIAGRPIARRRSRDSAVTLENGAVLVSGGFGASGGSSKSPRIGCPIEDTVIRVSIPRAKLDGIKTEYQIEEVAAKPGYDRAALLEEKEKLKRRLAEIDIILAQAR